MTKINCPHCGKPLTKESGKNKYCCENERCPVVFVCSPTNPFKRKVVFESSVMESTVRKIKEATAYEIRLARLDLLSSV
jgi:hypothetical protein